MTGESAAPLLVVEDEQSVLGLFATWLNDEGYEIVTCSRYEDARRYLASQTPAALVTDIRLGAYNGLQLATVLHDRRPDVPIVIVSAYDDSLMREETKRLGGVFLVKPLRREDLISTLREAKASRI
jgi:DNA-binding NtrC family response regulator